jgi:anaerobic magnesium-protoporphyrin IX monomethyl ester cyclase
MKVLFAEPSVKYPNKIQADGRRAEIGIRLNYALLAGYLRDNHPDVEIHIRSYRFLDFTGQEYSIEDDVSEADVVCIGASTAEVNSALRIAQLAKSLGKTTVLGGLFPSSNAEYVLRRGVDYVVRGEGEQTLLELIQALDRKQSVDSIDGLSFRKDGAVINNKTRRLMPDINEVRPAYDLLPMQEYARHVKGIVYSSRGCNNGCSFCTVSPHWQYTQRSRSIDSVIEEIRQYSEMGFSEINFKDESIATDKARLEKLLDRIKAENLGMQFKAKVRIREVDEQTLDALRKAGFTELHTGIESITQPFEKGLSVKELFGRIKLCLDYGFTLNPSFILGLPGQTPDNLRTDADFIMSVGRHEKVKVYTCMYTPHPGTRARDDDRVTIVSDDFDDYTHLRLVAVPKNLGTTEGAIMLLHEVQKKIVETVGGTEAELCTAKV